MTFVNEPISEADSLKANWKQFKEYQNVWNAPPSHWTIDRDRNIYLWHIQGLLAESRTEIFGLFVQNTLVRIYADVTFEDSPGINGRLADFHWRNFRISIPESSGLQADLII